MHKYKSNILSKIILIFIAETLLFVNVGCDKKNTASGTSKTIKKKKIKCSSCKTKTANYNTPNEFNNQHLINIA